jgi:ribonuclease HI
VIIHTDGGCEGNPGPGGWAAVLEYGSQRKEISGAVAATTNNRMELTAAIEALRVLRQSCEVELFTDSAYLRSGILNWVPGWKRTNWRTSTKTPVKNKDLWVELDALSAKHRVTWKWLKGHAGHAGNERCDELARDAIIQLRRSLSREQLAEHLVQFKATVAPSEDGELPQSLLV